MTPRYDVLAVHPEMVEVPLRASVIGRAVEAGVIELGVHDIRAHTADRHRSVDDTPYGGGAGMVMKEDVLARAIDAVRREGARREVLQAGTLDLFEDAGGSADGSASEELSRTVSAAIAELPQEQREVVVLKVYDGMKFREVAELTGTSENTAASRFRYACEKLRSKLMRLIENG